MDEVTRLFKDAFRRHAASVAVVVGTTPDGPLGLTASSVASVSADPPVLSFSVARSSATAATLVALDHLVVHLLGAGQADVAVAFAQPATLRGTDSPAAPDLAGSTAALHVRPTHVVPAGASWLVVAEVDGVEPGAATGPLLHHDRGYWHLGARLDLPPR